MHRFVIGWMILLAACTETPAERALSVCSPLCRCIDVPLPSAQRDCTAMCVADFEQDPAPDACAACVIEHADRCTTLIDDCIPACVRAIPLESYGAANELGALGIEDR